MHADYIRCIIQLLFTKICTGRMKKYPEVYTGRIRGTVCRIDISFPRSYNDPQSSWDAELFGIPFFFFGSV